MDANFLLMEWQNGFEATLDARVVLTDTYIPMTPVPNGNFGRLVLEDTSRENFEIIRYNRKDAGGVYVETGLGGLRNEDGSSSGIHPRGARVRGNITAQDVRELRKAAKDVQDGYMAMAAGSDWRAIAVTPTVVANNGQHEHVLRYAGVNYTGVIPDGAKLKIPRTGTVPTQSATFVAASSQTATKVAPAGLNFTNTFSYEAIVNLPLYPTGNPNIIMRTNGTSGGYGFGFTPAGQVRAWNWGIQEKIAHKSIPLGRDVHVAATVDLATNTIRMYVDGREVPSYQLGSVGTSITQVGDLTMGKEAVAASYLGMGVSNVRLWSTVRTAAQIRDNMYKELVGNEAGLVGCWKLNGNFNDSTANANHLTPANGAVATTVKHAFSTIEYARVMKSTYTGGNTDVTIFTGPCALPNDTLGATSYSTAPTPIGFPADKEKWIIEQTHQTNMIVSGPVANSWYSTGGGYSGNHPATLEVPTGPWKVKYDGSHAVQRTGAASGIAKAGIATTPNGLPITKTIRGHYHGSNVSSIHQIVPLEADLGVSNTAMTPYYICVAGTDAATSEVGFRGDLSPLTLTAELNFE